MAFEVPRLSLHTPPSVSLNRTHYPSRLAPLTPQVACQPSDSPNEVMPRFNFHASIVKQEIIDGITTRQFENVIIKVAEILNHKHTFRFVMDRIIAHDHAKETFTHLSSVPGIGKALYEAYKSRPILEEIKKLIPSSIEIEINIQSQTDIEQVAPNSPTTV